MVIETFSRDGIEVGVHPSGPQAGKAWRWVLMALAETGPAAAMETRGDRGTQLIARTPLPQLELKSQ